MKKNREFIQEILNSNLDTSIKGISEISKVKLKNIPKKKWNILNEDVQFPILTINKSVFRKNIDSMHMYASSNNIFLAPHSKTSMSPQLLLKIKNRGCWGFTVANNQQLSVLLRMGINRIIIANLITNKSNLLNLFKLTNKYSSSKIYLCVDSQYGANLIYKLAKEYKLNTTIRIFIEIGNKNSRSGIRNINSFKLLCNSLKKLSENFLIAGVLFYEGATATKNYSKTLKNIDRCIKFSFECISYLQKNELVNPRECIISGGGSEYFDLITHGFKKYKENNKIQLIIRPGSYIAYGHGYYQRSLEKINNRKKLFLSNKSVKATKLFSPSLELWSYVISQQDKGKAILNFGKRDVSFDLGNPIPLAIYRNGKIYKKLKETDKNIKIYKLNDQHAFLQFKYSYNIQVGDLLKFGVSHPCISIDKWNTFYMIDNNHYITEAIRSFF